MTASPVRPGFGPTLPELLATRPRWLRRGLLLLAVAAALAAALAVVRGQDAGRLVVQARGTAFNLDPGQLRRVAARPGEALRLEPRPGAATPQSLVVRPLRLAPYAGDPVAALMAQAQLRADRLRRELDALVVRGEGRTRINDQPGYQLQYQFRRAGRTAYGRLVLLVPPEDEAPRPDRGAELDLRTDRDPAVVPTVFAAGDNGALKTPLRSFRLGTEGP